MTLNLQITVKIICFIIHIFVLNINLRNDIKYNFMFAHNLNLSKYKTICDVGRENIPLVAESEAEKITIIHRAVID